METLECRGLACPLPVMRVRDRLAVRPGEPFVVLVDNPAAMENVSRFVAKGGGTAAVERQGDDFRIAVTPAGSAEPAPASPRRPAGVVVLAARDRLGEGDAELGELLAKGFFHTLLETPALPSAIVCVNAGVRLAATPGQIADDLKALEERGVTVLSCGTCLAHYGLKDSLLAGKVSNMYEIAETLLAATTVIPL